MSPSIARVRDIRYEPDHIFQKIHLQTKFPLRKENYDWSLSNLITDPQISMDTYIQLTLCYVHMLSRIEGTAFNVISSYL